MLIGLAERRRNSVQGPRLWPTFWFSTGGLLLAMAVGRASNISSLLADLGREQARSGGWYDVRRSLQAWVIAAVAAVWAVTVVVAIWRVPERRRRYLPTAIVVFTLVCFVGIRLISLHQVDALLHDRDLGGVTVGAVIEVGLLMLVIAVIAWRIPRSDGARPELDARAGAGQRRR